MSAPENPAAFPRPIDQVGPKHVGMELRDWFAGQALVGLCAAPNLNDASAAAIVRGAYRLADAMLVERQRSALS